MSKSGWKALMTYEPEVKKFSADQPRDDHGRWTGVGSGPDTSYVREPAVMAASSAASIAGVYRRMSQEPNPGRGPSVTMRHDRGVANMRGRAEALDRHARSPMSRDELYQRAAQEEARAQTIRDRQASTPRRGMWVPSEGNVGPGHNIHVDDALPHYHDGLAAGYRQAAGESVPIGTFGGKRAKDAAWLVNKYSPDQPRDTGGKWTAGSSAESDLMGAANAMHGAGLKVYLDRLGGPRLSDSTIPAGRPGTQAHRDWSGFHPAEPGVKPGEQDPRISNLQAWSRKDNGDGTRSMMVAVRGGEHGLYTGERIYHSEEDDNPELVLDHGAVDRMGGRIGSILSSSGMDLVGRPTLATYDSGWGSKDVHYQVNYRPKG